MSCGVTMKPIGNRRVQLLLIHKKQITGCNIMYWGANGSRKLMEILVSRDLDSQGCGGTQQTYWLFTSALIAARWISERHRTSEGCVIGGGAGGLPCDCSDSCSGSVNRLRDLWKSPPPRVTSLWSNVEIVWSRSVR
jgi:hypothetical protein